MPQPARRRVLHVITTLESAGAQVQLVDLIDRLRDSRYDSAIAYLIGDAGIARGVCPLVDLSRGGRFDPLSAFALARYLRRERIDLVHTHLVHAGIVGKLAARLTGVRAVVTTRHYARELKSGSLVYRLEDRLTRGADRVIAVSQSVRSHLLRERIADADRIEVIPNGVDFAFFDRARLPEQKRESREGRVLGTVGRLHPQKGQDDLLRAFAILSSRYPDLRLEIVGEGPLRPALQGLTRELGVENRVSFLGILTREALRARLAAWELFALPSRWEAFGIALLEAMAMELPVVASAVEGIAELVSHEVNGRLVPPNDPGALAAEFERLLLRPEEAREMGRRAREEALSRFDLAAAASRLVATYDQLLALRG
ncbi:MAG: glycosyltransferase [Candidatus Eisenbacteria bacterium]